MKKLYTEKDRCSGCAACEQACPKHCIKMESDAEGFLYPHVDFEECVDCGLCEKVCHNKYQSDERIPLKSYAAINPDEKVRGESSSGGVFSALALIVLQAGGVVFGARYDEKWQVKLDYVEKEEELTILRGSKYVQARTDRAYLDAERFLKADRLVLFSGTPCQISGLHHFLRKQYNQLLTVDVVCHGVPSPKVWMAYLKEATKCANMKRISVMSSFHDRNPYMQAFIENLILRPSCHNCTIKQSRGGSDLTIADFWGVQYVCPQMFDNRGTSLVMVNTEKGLSFFSRIQIAFREVSYGDDVLYHNPAIVRSFPPHPKRQFFFSQFDNSENVVTLIKKSLKLPILQRLKVIARNSLKKENHTNDFVPDSLHLVPSSDVKMTTEKIRNINFRCKKGGWLHSCLEIKW